MSDIPAPVRVRMTPQIEARVAERLVRRIDARTGELVELARALIRVPTVNPPGERYPEAVALIGERLAGRGFEVVYERALGAPGDSEAYPRSNLIARVESRVAGPTVHISGRIDVAPPGVGWSVDPFAGELRGGQLLGRGAAAVKGGLAAAIIALETLKEELPRLPGAIELSVTVDGLSGAAGGLGFLGQLNYLEPPRVDHLILLEAGGAEAVAVAAAPGATESPVLLALEQAAARAGAPPLRRIPLPDASGLHALARAGLITSLAAYGPGTPGAGDAADEAVVVAELVLAAKILALAAHKVLSSAPDAASGPQPPMGSQPD
ncbi:MAG: M20/M25/M40 family metallo-hydrolase [Alphaproteobacteria bacterium]|nr:M20/M25/M40 family metallo-hydrolase [Alphaproteobacteria bacterium]